MRRKKAPSYCRHKATGQAVVRIDGPDGKLASTEGRDRHDQLLAEW